MVLSKRDQLLDISFLVITYIVSIVLVNPLGDFRLDDDWSFARAVKGLIEQGDWRPTGWTAMPLITQSLWGSIFCIPAGFSFNALRFSTLALALVGILGVYILFITNDRSRLLAVTAALTLGFNPIYYVLSNTFMTDIPFTAFAILSSIFFVHCIRRFRYLDLAIACGLAVAATLCRQLGLFLPIAFLVALLTQRGLSIRWLARAVLPLVICVTILLLFQQWMRITGRTPALYGSFWDKEGLSISTIFSRIDKALLYLGLFCLPILLLGFSKPWINTDNTVLRGLPALSGSLFAFVSIIFAFKMLRAPMPISKNILVAQGLGPLTFGGYQPLPRLFWLIVTGLSLVGGVLLVRGLVASSVVFMQKFRTSGMEGEDIIQIFCLTAAGVYAFPILWGGFFDRYLVPLMPFLLFSNSGSLPRESFGATMRKSAAAVLITITAAFGILGTRDFLTWHRVGWQALAELQQTAGISTHDIDGGFEYNGWFFDGLMDRKTAEELFFNANARYRIATSVKPQFKIIGKYEYLNWMPPKVRTLFLLEHLDE